MEQHLDVILEEFNKIYLSPTVNTTYDSNALLTVSKLINVFAHRNTENTSTQDLHKEFSSMSTVSSDPSSLSPMDPITTEEE